MLVEIISLLMVLDLVVKILRLRMLMSFVS